MTDADYDRSISESLCPYCGRRVAAAPTPRIAVDATWIAELIAEAFNRAALHSRND